MNMVVDSRTRIGKDVYIVFRSNAPKQTHIQAMTTQEAEPYTLKSVWDVEVVRTMLRAGGV